MSTENVPPFSWLPQVSLTVGVLCVSTSALLIRLCEAPPLVVAAYRMGIAWLILLPFVGKFCFHELKKLKAMDYFFAFLTGLFLALHFGAWIPSLLYTSVASSVVLVNTAPLWVAFLAFFFRKEKISLSTWIGLAVSFLGMVILCASDFQWNPREMWGNFLAFLGAWGTALYLFLGKDLRTRLGFLSYIFLCYGFCALCLWGVVLISNLPLLGYSTQSYCIFFLLALVPQIMGHGSYNYSLAWFSSETVSIALLGEPILGSFSAYFFLEEKITSSIFLGGMFILTGIYVAIRGESIAKKEIL